MIAAVGAAVVWAGILGGVGVAAAAEKPCVMPVAGGVAPCPPPIVSTNGDSIGGGANTDPVNMGDLPRTGPDYSYEAPTWEPAPEPEPTPEPDPEPETPAE
ncbi:hypothetical protein PBI_WALRUS_37 [Gordonia phage Walrus]|uniref:Uncharacterized protein n=1 Tax=Gordonia phage Walrus TaxID=2517927 RepID=A0A481S1P0_9CAUD|nr:hypothetical protein KNU50_gp37 [Gordonia phage Walrus]QBG78428.1 hypothetical protein PBI_WALRUS_37 [Gordonia phage Walrus]